MHPGAYGVAVYLDDPETKAAEDLNSLAGVFVPDSAGIGDLEETRLPGGKFFKAEFIGHYSGLGEAWGAVLGKLLPESGERIRDGVCFEVYMNDMRTTPPEQLRTDIYVPIS
jgi:AraC family transcriptional regulator